MQIQSNHSIILKYQFFANRHPHKTDSIILERQSDEYKAGFFATLASSFNANSDATPPEWPSCSSCSATSEQRQSAEEERFGSGHGDGRKS